MRPLFLRIMLIEVSFSATDLSQKYRSRIDLLLEGYRNALPGIPASNYKVKTYVGDLSKIERVSGTITIQYTPFQREDEDKDKNKNKNKKNCNKIAAAKVWAEEDINEVIDHEWEQ
jgi:hypothetical protein